MLARAALAPLLAAFVVLTVGERTKVFSRINQLVAPDEDEFVWNTPPGQEPQLLDDEQLDLQEQAAPPGTCGLEAKTGGTCRWKGKCAAIRGETRCLDGLCVCQEGYCLNDAHQCVSTEEVDRLRTLYRKANADNIQSKYEISRLLAELEEAKKENAELKKANEPKPRREAGWKMQSGSPAVATIDALKAQLQDRNAAIDALTAQLQDKDAAILNVEDSVDKHTLGLEAENTNLQKKVRKVRKVTQTNTALQNQLAEQNAAIAELEATSSALQVELREAKRASAAASQELTQCMLQQEELTKAKRFYERKLEEATQLKGKMGRTQIQKDSELDALKQREKFNAQTSRERLTELEGDKQQMQLEIDSLRARVAELLRAAASPRGLGRLPAAPSAGRGLGNLPAAPSAGPQHLSPEEQDGRFDRMLPAAPRFVQPKVGRFP